MPLPTPTTNPDPSRLLVHVETWLWVQDWAPVTASASVPGVTVTVTATPERVTWAMGDGGRVVCDGPGTAYDRSRPEQDQSTDCAYTYRRSSAGQPGDAYTVTVTMTWRVSWTATGIAADGDLGSVTRTSQFAARVAEGQALITE